MTAYVAFLRGVNLGRRTVRSADLVEAFATLGFSGVATLIASGNVKFEGDGDEPALRARIEQRLGERFGFAIGVVLRRRDELQQMVAADPFAGATESAAQKLYVTLFATPDAGRLALPCRIPGDFEVVGVTTREIFHIAYRKPDGRYAAELQGVIWKPFGNAILWTNRNWNTIVKAAGLQAGGAFSPGGPQ